MTFAPRSYDPSRPSREPSPKQKAARDRNWQIYKLRGLYWLLAPLTGERLIAARAAVDAELELLGTESVSARRDRERRERESYEKFRAALIGDLPVY